MANDDCDGLPCDVARNLEALRREFADKHQQNRRDIHDLRNGQQTIMNQQALLDGHMEALIGNGQPGAIAKLGDTIDKLKDEIAEMRGARKLMAWLVPLAVTLLAGVLATLIGMWASRSGHTALGVSSNTVMASGAQKSSIPQYIVHP